VALCRPGASPMRFDGFTWKLPELPALAENSVGHKPRRGTSRPSGNRNVTLALFIRGRMELQQRDQIVGSTLSGMLLKASDGPFHLPASDAGAGEHEDRHSADHAPYGEENPTQYPMCTSHDRSPSTGPSVFQIGIHA